MGFCRDGKLCADVEEFAKQRPKTREWLSKQLWIANFLKIQANQNTETRIINVLPPPGQLIYVEFCRLFQKQMEESKPDHGIP